MLINRIVTSYCSVTELLRCVANRNNCIRLMDTQVQMCKDIVYLSNTHMCTDHTRYVHCKHRLHCLCCTYILEILLHYV